MTSSIFERGTYIGEELQHRSSRPGAYDAFAIPSLGTCRARQSAPPPMAAEAQPAASTLAAAVPPRAARTLTQGGISLSEYHPRQGSIPSLLITELARNGGHLTYAQISERLGVARYSMTAIFKSAIVKGALVRHIVADGQVALALPGYVYEPPAPASVPPATIEVAAPARMATFSEVAAAHAALEQRRAELKLWRDRVAALEQHARFRAVISDIHRFAYPIHATAT